MGTLDRTIWSLGWWGKWDASLLFHTTESGQGSAERRLAALAAVSNSGGVVTRTDRRGSAYRWGVGLLVLAMGFVVAAIPPSPSAQAEPLSVKYGSIALETGADLVVDHDAGLAYVSQKLTREIKVIDLSTAEVVEAFGVPGTPVGLELSPEGSELFVALFKEGMVAVVDTANGSVKQTFDIRAKAGSDRTLELKRVGNRLFVASDSQGAGDPHLVAISLSTEASWRVTGAEHLRYNWELAWDGEALLYVGDSYGDLVSFAINSPGSPVNAGGFVSLGNRMATSPTAVLTGLGEVLDPLDFSVVLDLGREGFPARDGLGSTFYLASEFPDRPPIGSWTNTISRYQSPAWDAGPEFITECQVPDVLAFEVLPDDAGLLILGEDQLCLVPPLPAHVGTCGGLEPTLAGSDGDDDFTGTNEADVIVGLGGDDTIDGLKGNDVICGGAGDDSLMGSVGNDQLIGGGGADILDGGLGNDDMRGKTGIDTAVFTPQNPALPFSHVEVDLSDGVATGLGDDSLKDIENVIGSEGDDILFGDAGPNVIDGYSGSNVIRGRGGDDHLIGFIFNDDLAGNGGNDLLEGGRGDDRLSGGYGVDTLLGGHGHDLADFTYSPGKVRVELRYMRVIGPVDDDLDGIEGAVGSKFNDVLRGDDGDNTFEGGKGADGIYGFGGEDVIDGGSGNDWLNGGSMDDRIWGGTGSDHLLGEQGSDLLVGGSEADELSGGDGDDDLDGGAGPDRLHGHNGDDLLLGGPGNDQLKGNEDVDLLLGQGGHDVLNGGSQIDAASFELAKGPITASLARHFASGDGDDQLDAFEALVGSHSADKLTGDSKANILIGLSGSDALWGGEGLDDLYGDDDDDFLHGEANNDFLHGGAGFDRLNGGTHVDQCVEGEVLDSCEYIAGVNGVMSFLDQQRADGYRAMFRERLAEWERSASERVRPVAGSRNVAAPMLGESLLATSSKGLR